MRITLSGGPLHEEEHRSRALALETDANFDAQRIWLAFLTPLGKRLVSEDLTFENGQSVYVLPSAVLDGAGLLLAQLVAEDSEGRVKKSDVFGFQVEPSLTDGSMTVEGGTLSLKDVREDVQGILEALPTLALKSELPVVPTAVSAFFNDAGYLTQHQSLDNYATKDEVRGSVPAISTDIAADAASDAKTASPKAVKTFVEGKGYVTSADLPTKVSDLTDDAGYLNATQVGTTIWNWIETNGIDYDAIYDKPAISTDISADASSYTKVASPRAVKEYVDSQGGGGGGLQPGDNVSELVNDAGYIAAEVNTVSYHIGQMQDLGNGVYIYGTTFGQDEAAVFDALDSAYPNAGIYYDGMLMTRGEINGSTYFACNADPVTLSPIDPDELAGAIVTDYSTNFAVFLTDDLSGEDLELSIEWIPAAEGYVENRLHDELEEKLGGLKLKKAYEGTPSSAQEGDIAHDAATDTWGIYSGGNWSQYTPDPNTLYFLVEP